ncbi:MAG: DUF4845 domain-containing protein [Thiohalomonadaceae bacterium]
MFVLAVLAVFVLFMLRVVPAYLEDFGVSSTLRSLNEDKLATYSTPEQVRTAVMRRLSINNVDNVTAEDIEIERVGRTFHVTANYEVRESFMFNIDLVLTFNHRVEVPAS